ncbi:MAG: hypothetical protein AAB660_01190 [Patescibacteria group bacterium]
MSVHPKEIIFDKQKGTLLLSLSVKDTEIPKFVEKNAKEQGLIKKDEFHITVFGFGLGQKIIKKLSELYKNETDEVLNSIEKLANETKWNISFLTEVYKIRKKYNPKDGGEEERESYILMIKLDGLAKFIDIACTKLNMHLDVPPAHITLYSKSTVKENMGAGIGISSAEDFKKLHPTAVFPDTNKSRKIKTIALPTRSQPDTIIAIFVLKQFGGEKFSGIAEAHYEVMPRLSEGETEESLMSKGILPIDIGQGMFDHHSKPFQTTASNLVSEYLGVKNNPALTKLLQFAERDDFYGKGIISNDPLDRAFGLSGLIGSLNKMYVDKPEKVVELILPILEAFYVEENKRAFEMPKELEEKLKNGKAHSFEVKQREKIIRGIFIETDNASMAGFLRSKGGGGYDVVALRLSSGHINILTKPITKPDLRSLVVLIRIQEAEAKGLTLPDDPEKFSKTGTLSEIPEWYYDPATNSLLNGGPNPQNIKPTSIDPFEFKKLIELGLSEQLWKP